MPTWPQSWTSPVRLRDTLRILAFIAALALVSSFFMVWLMNRLVAAPLRAVTGVAERVAAGDLTVRIEDEKRWDEVGAMQRPANMIDNLRSLNKELQNGFGILASSSTEILATVSQVAAGAARDRQRRERNLHHGRGGQADRPPFRPGRRRRLEEATQKAATIPRRADRPSAKPSRA